MGSDVQGLVWEGTRGAEATKCSGRDGSLINAGV